MYYYMKMYHVGVFFLVNCATRDNIGEWPTSFAKSAKGLFDALQLVLVLSEPQQNFDSLCRVQHCLRNTLYVLRLAALRKTYLHWYFYEL